MPSVIRFLLVIGILAAMSYGGLYALAIYLEPPQTEVKKLVPGVKIRRE